MKSRTIITSALLGMSLTLGAVGVSLADTPTAATAATVAASPVAAPAPVKSEGHKAMVAKGRHGERRFASKHSRHGARFARAKSMSGPVKTEGKAG